MVSIPFPNNSSNSSNNFKKTIINETSALVPPQNIQAEESVLGGMIRVVHAAKNEGNEFVLNPRIKTYFQNECGLSPNQIEFIRNFSIELAR